MPDLIGHSLALLSLSDLLFSTSLPQLLEFQELKSRYDSMYQRQQRMTEVSEGGERGAVIVCPAAITVDNLQLVQLSCNVYSSMLLCS